MLYNEMCGDKVSALGFGCMRLPMNGEKIDTALASRMLDETRDAGVNYFDTAYFYIGSQSEPFVGDYLSKLPRDSYYVATKMPLWSVNEGEKDLDKIFEDQLKKLKTDHIDFYLLHSMSQGTFDKAKEIGAVEWLKKQKKKGRIRHMGFSFHDSYEVFEKHITGDWVEFVQLQYNYMDIDDQAGDKGLDLSKSLNIPVIVMEPVKGGTLANLPENIAEPFRKLHPDWSIASWAIRFAVSRDGVKHTLSGMSTLEQVRDNLGTVIDFKPLTEEELDAVWQVRQNILNSVKNGCTDCRYCMPCPFGVNIPGNFSIWNTYHMYGDKGGARGRYNRLKEEERGSNCQNCGQCEELCPQKIKIRDDLAAASAELEALLK